MKQFTVNKNDSTNRLDKFISKVCPSMPLSLVYKSIRKKRVKVNGKRITELSYKLCEGDVLELYINDEFFEERANPFMSLEADINVVYEDENIIIVNKKRGMVVHEDDENTVATLINHIKKYLYDKGEYNPETENSFAPSLCHRLDRNTGGLVIAAKTAEALRIMNEKIKNREIRKFYKCIVRGEIKPSSGTAKAFILKDSDKNEVSVFDHPVKDGKTAITAYKTVETNGFESILQIELITGRTHQIRAHMAHLKHPLAGDTKYGDVQYNRKTGRKFQELYAFKIIFDFKEESGVLEYLKNKEIAIDVDLKLKKGD